MGSRTFAKAPEELNKRVNKMLNLYHSQDLAVKDFEANVETMLVYGPRNKDGIQTAAAIVIRGREALACVRITKLEERVAGRGDAVIWIDGDQYKRWSPEVLEAIIDHELQHLELRRNPEDDTPMTDDQSRPLLTMRPHDFEFGWFDAVAERHKMHAVEVIQAAMIAEKRQLYFPGFVMDPRSKRKKETA